MTNSNNENAISFGLDGRCTPSDALAWKARQNKFGAVIAARLSGTAFDHIAGGKLFFQRIAVKAIGRVVRPEVNKRKVRIVDPGYGSHAQGVHIWRFTG